MSSVSRRITIEEYVNGGWGFFIEGEPDVMGLESFHEVLVLLAERVEE